VPGGLRRRADRTLARPVGARPRPTRRPTCNTAPHELAADPTDATSSASPRSKKFGNWAATKPSPKCHGSRPDWVSRRTSSWRTSIRSRRSASRVDLMRVLYEEPTTMVLDERRTNLDKAASAGLRRARRFRGTVLVISHDLPLLDKSIESGVGTSRRAVAAVQKATNTNSSNSKRSRRRVKRTASHQDEQIERPLQLRRFGSRS